MKMLYFRDVGIIRAHIKSGYGLLVGPSEKVTEYKKLLIEYYESNDST